MIGSTWIRTGVALFLAGVWAGCTFDEESHDLLTDERGNARPYFELEEGGGGAYYSFRFADVTGSTLLESDRYESRLGALGGVVSVLDNAGLETRYEIVTTEAGGYRLELSAANGAVIAESRVQASARAAEARADEIAEATADYLESRYEEEGPRFDVYEEPTGRYRFAIYAGGEEPAVTSQTYASEAAALNGAVSAKENGEARGGYRIAERGEDYELELRAKNGKTLAESGAFESREEAESLRDELSAWMPHLRVL